MYFARMAHSTDIRLADAEATADFARALAPKLAAQDVLLLTGDIGAGKTHFARAVIQTLLPIPEDVPSPTFTLVQVYDTSDFEIWHADLYRLTSPDEVVELGLTEAFSEALCMVEWPDRLAELAPADALSISFERDLPSDGRLAKLEWSSPRWTDILSDLL